MFWGFFWAPYARTTRYEEAFFPWKTKEKKARFARAPHDYNNRHLPVVIVLRGSGINVLHEKRKRKKRLPACLCTPGLGLGLGVIIQHT